LIGKALRKYGQENFIFGWIEFNLTEKAANELEIKQIAFWKTNIYRHGNDFGYNMTDGGEGTSGRVISSEFRDFCSDFQQNRTRTEDERKSASERITEYNTAKNHMKTAEHRLRQRKIVLAKNPMSFPGAFEKQRQTQRERTPQLKNFYENAWLVWQLRQEGMMNKDLCAYFEVTKASVSKVLAYFRRGDLSHGFRD
jgi:hypothetical protein